MTMGSTTQLEFATVDVFTSRAYEGNPLAIVRVPPGSHVSQDQKQAIACEFNLSETTFLHENGKGSREDSWTVDIFITYKEIPFAGHPTIGTACYILGRVAQERGVQDGVIEASFQLKAGPVGLQYDVARRVATASIPHNVHMHGKRLPREEIFALQPQVAEAHHRGKISAEEDFPVVSIVKGMTFVLVELENLEALGLVSLAGRGLVVDDLDKDWSDTFISTYFFVRVGKDEEGVTKLRTRMIEGSLEDPATGSAASDLAAYLALTEGKPNETLKFEIVQGVEMGRKSNIFVEIVLSDDKSISKVYLKGGAVQIMEGRLSI